MMEILNITDLPSAFYFGLRLVVAVGAGILGWFLAAPLATGLYRLAFHKQISPSGAFGSRVSGAIVLGLLAFILIPIGSGGGGWGGPGTGPGGGASGGDSQNQGGGSGFLPGGSGNGKTATQKEGPKADLPIEIVTVDRYAKDNEHCYLIQQKEPPKTIEEVDAFLQETKGKWKLMVIIIYSNSLNYKDEPVKRLEQAASKYGLNTIIPREYFTIEKAPNKAN